MEINGIKVSNIKDAQDVLTALQTIRYALENLSDNMNTNYDNYNNIVDNLDNSTEVQKGIIDAISTLQINTQKLFNNHEKLIDTQNEINENSKSTLQREFIKFDAQIKNTMSNVINSIDLFEFRQQVKTLFEEKINSLEKEVVNLHDINTNLEILNNQIISNSKAAKTEMIKSIRDTKNEIDNSIKEFNRLSKMVSWEILFVVGFFSMLFGALVACGLDLSIFK